MARCVIVCFFARAYMYMRRVEKRYIVLRMFLIKSRNSEHALPDMSYECCHRFYWYDVLLLLMPLYHTLAKKSIVWYIYGRVGFFLSFHFNFYVYGKTFVFWCCRTRGGHSCRILVTGIWRRDLQKKSGV